MLVTEPLPYMIRETRRARLAEAPLAAEAVRWFEHCRMLRDFENKHLLADRGAEDLRAHRVVITDLIADGEILAWQARQSNVDLSPVGFKVEDIEAETRLLRDNFRLFHEPMAAEEAERQLQAGARQEPLHTPEVKSLADRIVARLDREAAAARTRLRAKLPSAPPELHGR